mmetsp:Transcript_50247/g.121708  ORF Transcript_50247/g.121708 Transcript_50247/m.121708 type:complete len:96 (+) Transcript_50247:71-358(+)
MSFDDQSVYPFDGHALTISFLATNLTYTNNRSIAVWFRSQFAGDNNSTNYLSIGSISFAYITTTTSFLDLTTCLLGLSQYYGRVDANNRRNDEER